MVSNQPGQIHQISIEEAGEEIRRLLKRLLVGEELIIMGDTGPIAKVIPMPPSPPRPTFGSARGLVTMTEDFDEPLADFQDYS